MKFSIGLKNIESKFETAKRLNYGFPRIFQGEDFNSTTRVLQFHEVSIWHYWTFFELIKSELYQRDLSTITWFFFAFHFFLLVLVCRCIHTLHNNNEIWQFKENSLKPKLHYPSLHIITIVNIHEYIHWKELTNYENCKNQTSFRTCTMAQKIFLKKVKLNTHGGLMSSWVCTRAFMRCYKEESTMNKSQGHVTKESFFLKILGRSLVLLRTLRSFCKLLSALKSTHGVLLRKIELQNLRPWHKLLKLNKKSLEDPWCSWEHSWGPSKSYSPLEPMAMTLYI